MKFDITKIHFLLVINNFPKAFQKLKQKLAIAEVRRLMKREEKYPVLSCLKQLSFKVFYFLYEVELIGHRD